MVILRKRGNIRIELAPETETAQAVAVTITPIGQADIDVASASIAAAAVKLEDRDAALARYGLDAGDVSAETVRVALRLGGAMMAIELGIRHIKAWEGVVTEDGAPAPIEPALIAMLFNEWAPATAHEPVESYGSRFMRKINGLSILEPGAKKGSGASPDGVSGAAPNTAATAD